MTNTNLSNSIDYDFDKAHIWHPYTSMTQALPAYGVVGAQNCHLQLDNGALLVDGTSSWWACVHGYGHPYIIEAMQTQLNQLSHVMFGGITHKPAIDVCKKLVSMTCAPLTKVFLADSGSIAVEVALKMALQYWQGKHQLTKQKILTVKQGYHGDTFAAMSVCDPEGGMHTMFGEAVTSQLFAPAPKTPFGDKLLADDLADMTHMLATHHHEIAAVIIEPILQGAGGMRFYSADYLTKLRSLCDQFNVLMIVDEIATGFGRTGKLFAYEHADITPDLICVGKALTGGYISLAATLCTDEVADGISHSPSGVFMHGPTFMANPLACAAASASLDLIAQNNWQQQVDAIEQQMREQLAEASEFASVKDVRVLGAIGVLEMHSAVNTAVLQQQFIDLGVWIRPFANFIYIMPPYTITASDLSKLTNAMKVVASELQDHGGAPGFISHG